MEEINKSIVNLEQQLEQSIKTLKKEYQLGIHNSQKHIKVINDIFDNGLKEFGIISPGEERSKLFNPEIVIDYNEKREPIKVIRKDDWDETLGFLPNRKVMYEIRLIGCEDYQLDIKLFNINTKLLNKISRINFDPSLREICQNNSSCIDCNNLINIKLYVDNYLNIMIDKYDETYLKNCRRFEQQKNKQDRQSMIYLCINKLPVPEYCFNYKLKLNNIYIEKKKGSMLFSEGPIMNLIHNYNKNEKHSIIGFKYFIPDNYDEVYQYFVKVRDMIHNQIIPFKKDREIKDKELETLKTDNESKDKEIAELKLQLQQKNNLLEKYKDLVS